MPDFTMPSLGADMESGVLVEWLVAPGDTVRRGQPIAVVDTDKAAIEVESFHDGLVEQLLVEPGTRVDVGGLMATIAAAAAGLPAAITPATAVQAAPAPAPRATRATVPTLAVATADANGGTAARPGRFLASPPVRHHAAEVGVDLAEVVGTGPGGRIRRADVDAAAGTAAAPGARTRPSSLPRRTIAPAGTISGEGRRRVSPYARRLADELGVDLDALGPGDSPVRAEDVRAVAAVRPEAVRTKPSTAPRAAAPSVASRAAQAAQPAQATRRGAVAHLMSRSKREIPHYYVATTVDLHALTEWLRRTNRDRSVTERIVPAAGILRATALAARQMPQLNGFWVDGAMVPGDDVHLGVAVSVRDGALVAPAIRHAADLTLPETMHALRDLVSRARKGRLTRAEMADPTITVTDLGDQGVEEVIGVIYPPQVALLGVGRIVERPWAVDGMLAVHPVARLTLSGDHRATDGSVGARFLILIDRLLQHPEEL